jgi:glutamyl-tRNA reductase
MAYLIVSFTHKNTNIETREKLAFNTDDQKEKFLSSILASETINEAILVSTCNRVEVICISKDHPASTKTILNELNVHSTISVNELKQRAAVKTGENAIHHLFTVVSSLDSLVVGETQIIGQIKDAFKYSVSKDFCAQDLARALHFSFKCAAKVRNVTNLGTGSVSVASTAVSVAKNIYSNDEYPKALVIGAGEMSNLAIRHLLKYGFDVVLINRSSDNATKLKNEIIEEKPEYEERIEIESYLKLTELINSMELVITATGANEPIIVENMIQPYRFTRNWFDIAVPRDIDNFDYPGVNVYAVDDLQCMIDDTLEQRSDQAKQGLSIVVAMRKEYFEWLKTLEVTPVIKKLHLKSENIIAKKLENAIKKGFVKEEDQENIKKLCQTVMAEFLHSPSANLRSLSQTNIEADVVLGSLQQIFDLNENSPKNEKQCDIPWSEEN